MFDRFLNKAAELLAKGEPFVTASVVRFQAPISGKPGDKAIIFPMVTPSSSVFETFSIICSTIFGSSNRDTKR